MRKRLLVSSVIGILALCLGSVSSVQASTTSKKAGPKIVQGQSCSTVGKTIESGRFYVCVQTDSKSIWAATCNPQTDTGMQESGKLSCEPLAATHFAVWLPAQNNSPTTARTSYPDVATPALSAVTDFQPATDCELDSTEQGNPPFTLSFDHGDWAINQGMVNIDVIFASYTDAQLNPQTFSKWENSEEPYAKEFYSDASYGKFHINFISSDKTYEIPKSTAVYNLDSPTADVQDLFQDAMLAAQKDYDYSQAEEIMLVMPDKSKISDFGPAYHFNATAQGQVIHYGVEGAYLYPQGGLPFNQGYFTHEFGLTLGLTEPALLPAVGVPYAWDVENYDSTYEQDFFTWEKLILGWITPNQMNCLDVSNLHPATSFISPDEIASPDNKMIVIKLSATQAIVVESRRNSEIDPLTSSEEGVLVYKLDLNKGFRQGNITLLYNNPQMKNGPQGPQIIGTLHQGESISSDGVTIKVLKFTEGGDYVLVSKSSS